MSATRCRGTASVPPSFPLLTVDRLLSPRATFIQTWAAYVASEAPPMASFAVPSIQPWRRRCSPFSEIERPSPCVIGGRQRFWDDKTPVCRPRLLFAEAVE